MADFRANDDMMSLFIIRMNALRESMITTTDHIVQFQKTIYESEDWIGNGKEECAALLSLISKYAGLISGSDVVVTDSGSTSVLAGKEATGSNEHIYVLLESMQVFHERVKTFEKSAADKAPCIQILDMLQGD